MWWNFVARTHEEIVQATADWNDDDGGGSGRFGRPVASHFARIPAPYPSARKAARQPGAQNQ